MPSIAELIVGLSQISDLVWDFVKLLVTAVGAWLIVRYRESRVAHWREQDRTTQDYQRVLEASVLFQAESERLYSDRERSQSSEDQPPQWQEGVASYLEQFESVNAASIAVLCWESNEERIEACKSLHNAVINMHVAGSGIDPETYDFDQAAQSLQLLRLNLMNVLRRTTGRAASPTVIEDWLSTAKSLEPMLTHRSEGRSD